MSFLDSKRIIGTNTERTGADAISGGWKEIGRTTLGSAGDAIDVTSLADKRYLMILGSKIPSGNSDLVYTFNSDSASNYTIRFTDNGGSDGTGTSQGRVLGDNGGATTPSFQVGYVANKSDQEKMIINQAVGQNTAGAGNVPVRRESIGRWANTSNSISSIQGIQQESGDLASGSEVVVLGWDPADTHTDNFWEQLASVELSSGNATIDSGTITAKKYLWFQVYCAGSTASNRCHIRMNSLSTGIYADRYSSDGGSDSTDTSSGSARISNNNNTDPKFVNGFIINTSSNEKLGIAHEVGVNGATNAGAAPQRTSSAFKIATNTQATSLQIVNISGNWSAGSFLKVWGSN
jgi:hypothetical protein